MDTGIFGDTAMPVDFLVNPEQIVTHDIRRLIENPGALQVMDFAAGQVQLVAYQSTLWWTTCWPRTEVSSATYANGRYPCGGRFSGRTTL